MSIRYIIGIIFFSIVAMFFVFSALMMHPFGRPESTEMDDHIIGGTNETGAIIGAQNDTGANNAVTSVVFDYRGFDTLGEATVLFTAVAGVILIFRRVKKK